jgi:hypothetical protein
MMRPGPNGPGLIWPRHLRACREDDAATLAVWLKTVQFLLAQERSISMKNAVAALALGLLLISGIAAHAERAPSVLVPSKVTIENSSDKPMACGILFAHWYREDFKTMAPGASVTLPMDFSPPTQTVYVINSVNHPMAVQDLFCSASGADWKAVSHLDYRALAMKAVELGKPLRLKCTHDKSTISCESYTQ